MLSPERSSLSTRIRRSFAPSVVAGSTAVGVIALVLGVLVAVLGFLAVGLLFGGISTSPSGVLAQALLVNVVLYGSSSVVLLFGVVASALVHAGAHSGERRLVWSAVLGTLRVTPRVIVVVVGLVVALLATLFLWLPISLAGLIAAAVLYARHRRSSLPPDPARARMSLGTRRSLLAAIPLAVPVSVAALLLAALPAAIAGPRSIRELLARALRLVRAHKRRLAALTAATFSTAALLSWAGTTAATAIDDAATTTTDPLVATALSTLAVSAAVVLLMATCGAILAIVAPPSLTGTPTRTPREPFEVSRVFRVKSLLARRVAMVTVLAVVGTLIPTTAQAASLAPMEPGDLIVPELTLGRDGGGASVQLYAEVRVDGGDPAGTVQFFDGATALGAPLALAGSWDPAVASAYFAPGFDPGTHLVSYRYTPSSALVAPGTSDVADVSYTASSEVMLTSTATSGVGGPGHVDAAVVPGGSESTTLVPTGVVQFENDGVVTEVPLVGGVAALDIATVVDPLVVATYPGSDRFAPSVQTILLDGTPPVVVGTTVDASVYNPPHRVGSDLYASVQVSADDNSDVRRGSVEVYAGADLLVSSTMLSVYQNGIAIPTSTLGVGDVELRIVYVPGPGYAGSETSETVTLVPATTSVRLDSEPAGTVTWGDAHRIVVAVTSDLDGPRTLELRDTTGGADTLVATVPFTVAGGTASVPVDVTRMLLAYRHSLRATVLATPNSDAATSADTSVLVTRAPTTTTISTTGGVIGETLTVTAQVTSTAGGPLPGSVIFLLDGAQRSVALDPTGAATATFVPQELRTVRLSASYTNVDSGYAPSVATADVTVRPLDTPAPIVRWYAANGTELSPDDTRLELTYTAADGRTTPVGQVDILDKNDTVVATGHIADGVVHVTVPIVGNQRAFRARYAGFSPYAARTDALPAPAVQNWTPTVAVVAPASIALGTPFSTTVRVTDVPAGLIEKVTLFETTAEGIRTEIGTVVMDATGVGVFEHTAWTSGTVRLSAVVEYTAVSDLSSTVSEGTPVVVRPVPIPKLAVSTPMASGQLRGGDPVDLVVTAAILGDFSYGVPAGTRVTIVDETGTALGSTTLAHSQAGLTGSLRIEGLLGGVHELRALVVYGPLSQSVLGAPLSIELTTPYTRLVLETGTAVLGEWSPLRFTVYPTYPIENRSRPLPVTVTYEGRATTVQARASADGLSYSGTESVFTQQAGTNHIELSTRGDGITMAPATLKSSLYVAKLATTLTAVSVPPATAGFNSYVRFRLDQLPRAVSPSPTGGIRVRDELSGATCVIEDTMGCTLPGDKLRGGSSSLTATYGGDVNNDMSSVTVPFVVAPRPSTQFDVSFSPAQGNWVSGQPVTVSWTTRTAGPAATGRVDATIGGVSCSGPPTAGSCTVTLPRYVPSAPPQPLDHTVQFIPFDDAPPVRVTGSTTPRGCVVISAPGLSVDTSDASRCLLDGYPGVLTDSLVRFTPDFERGYVLDSWYINGIQRAGYPEPTLELRVNGALDVFANSRYSPKCATVSTGPARGMEKVLMGTVILVTPPNCAHPTIPTSDDQWDWTRGSARYAEGTVVEVQVIPWRGGSAPYEVRRMTGSTQVGAKGGIATTLVGTNSISVIAEFEDPRCTPFIVEPSLGGSVSSTSTRPNESRYVKPYSGACTTSDGRAGFIPGTQVTLTARADGGYGVGSFVTKTDRLYRLTAKGATTSDTVKDLGVNEVGTRSVGPHSSSVTLTTPVNGEMRYGASFNLFSCVAITTRGVVGKSAQELTVSGAEPCSDMPASRTTIQDRDKNYYTRGDTQVAQKTEWFVKSGTATIVAPATVSRAYESRYADDTFYPTWPRLGGSAVLTQGVSRGTGPTIDLEALTGPADVTANYYSVNCMAPAVATPVGGSYTVTMTETYIDCEVPRQLNGGRPALFTADPAVGAPKLKPYFYNPSTSFSYSRFQESKMSEYVDRSSSYSLLYCSELAITSRIKEVDGSYSTMDASETARFLGQDGGCGLARTLPGRVVTTQMSAAALHFYRAEGNNRPQGLTVSVDKAGNVTGKSVLELQRICYSVDPSEYVALITPANCPGGNGRQYTTGTVVEVEVQPDGERFDGWEQVDQEYGASAWVIADRNRTPTADIHEYRWYEKAVNWVSNTAQRVVGGLMTIATGIVLGALSLLSTVSLAMKGISAFLNVIGVSGSFVDGLNFASKVVTAQIDLIGLAASCTNSWAGAEPITDLPPTGDEFLDDAAATGVDELSGAFQDGLADALKNKGLKGAAGAAGQLGNAVTAVNTFVSNTGNYSRPAVEGWNRFSSDMGDCLSTGATDYGNAVTGGKFG